MKVCFVTSNYPPTYQGGPGELVYNLQKFLEENGHDAYVLTCGKNGKTCRKTLRVPGNKRSFLITSPYYFYKINKEINFDIINIHLESGMTIVPFLMFHNKPKVTTTLHTEYLIERQGTRPIKYKGFNIKPSFSEQIMNLLTPTKLFGTYLEMKISDKLYAVCENTRQNYVNQGQICSQKISVLYNGVDSKRFNPNISGETVKKNLHIFSQIILMVGNGSILKGSFFVLFGIQTILKTFPAAKFILIGVNKKQVNRINSLLDALGIHDNVILINNLPNEELPEYYAAADIVVIPSLIENFPIVMLEAMSSGKPVVASRIGGIPEAITNNKTGLLFEVGNVAQLVDKISYLLDNVAEGKKIGKAARRIVEQNFDYSIIGEQYLQEFKKLVSNNE